MVSKKPEIIVCGKIQEKKGGKNYGRLKIWRMKT